MTAAVLGLLTVPGVPAAVILLCLGYEHGHSDSGRDFPRARSASGGG